jgi:hypothetical protein
MAFTVAVCAGCGLAAWPRPAMCRRCGSLRFGSAEAPGGVLEEVAVAEPATLGTVRTDAGPVVVARVDGCAPGERVALEVCDGALTARRP